MTFQITATIEPARQNSQQKVSCRWLTFLTAFHHDEVGVVASGHFAGAAVNRKGNAGRISGCSLAALNSRLSRRPLT